MRHHTLEVVALLCCFGIPYVSSFLHAVKMNMNTNRDTSMNMNMNIYMNIHMNKNKNVNLIKRGLPVTTNDEAFPEQSSQSQIDPKLTSFLVVVSTICFLGFNILDSNLIEADGIGQLPMSSRLEALSSVNWLPWADNGQINWTELTFAFVMALSAFAQALTGFGFAIISVGCLSGTTWLLHSNLYELITPIAACLGAVVGAVLLLPTASKLKWNELLPLILPCTLATPVGVWVATVVNPALVNTALGLLILAFVAYLKFDAELPKFMSSKPATYILGGIAGLLGGAYDVQGPPLVVAGKAQGWGTQQFRDSVLAVVAINSAQVVAIDVLAGKLHSFYFGYYCLTSLPGVLLGLVVGQWACQMIDPVQFKQVLLVMCSALALKLLFAS